MPINQSTDHSDAPPARSQPAFHAHSARDRPDAPWHLLREHLTATGDQAACFAEPFGGQRLARLAGVLHDLGKYDPSFQRRLDGDPTRVEHSSAGAWMVERGELKPRDQTDRMLARLATYAIAGHHAGLADWDVRAGLVPTGGTLTDRLDAFDPAVLDPIWRNELVVDASNLAPTGMHETDPGRYGFMMAMLCRMLFSCLVDADYKDTEAYFAALDGTRPDRTWPALREIVDGLIGALDQRMTSFAQASDAPDASPVAGQVRADRARIHAHVRAHAPDQPGLFTLTVPTGGGKTLTSLGFALEHARQHGMRRIIYAIPFTSIIDQTASQFREILGDEAVLEHHSALEDGAGSSSEAAQGAAKLRLAMEDWAAPIVVTTNVQLFESLFANRPARCRKLHNIAGSVIVLDEAQALPHRLLVPCVRAIEELTVRYGCSVVLCTATQPALDQSHFPDPASPGIGLPLAGRELAPDPTELARRFRRVTLRQAGTLEDSELIDALARHAQAMVIVNSRAHALALYQSAQSSDLEGLIHLSTRQHADDRRAILNEVGVRLHNGHPCRLIATSLVESGVDIDFPRVWRAEAGLEQIAQAAGRCNREGRRPIESSVVTIFRASEHAPPRELQQLANDFARMRDRHADDLLAPESIAAYFREAYWRIDQELDREDIIGKFSMSRTGFQGAFRTASEKFRMIDSGMLPVIVPDERTARSLADLSSGSTRPGALSRLVQTRLVQVPPRARSMLIATGDAAFHDSAKFGEQFAVLIRKRLYRPDVGLVWERSGEYASDELIA